MFKSVTVSLLFTFAFGLTAVVAAPYQELPPRAGHVPVYIREGDTPLSEIHPRLAEAFGEPEVASLKLEDVNDKAALVAQPDALVAAAATTEAPAKQAATAAEAEQKTEVKAAEAEAEQDKAAPVEATTTEAADELAKTPESDIASFDVIKQLDAEAEAKAKAQTEGI